MRIRRECAGVNMRCVVNLVLDSGASRRITKEASWALFDSGAIRRAANVGGERNGAETCTHPFLCQSSVDLQSMSNGRMRACVSVVCCVSCFCVYAYECACGVAQ